MEREDRTFQMRAFDEWLRKWTTGAASSRIFPRGPRLAGWQKRS
jgi:hypothetical protein